MPMDVLKSYNLHANSYVVKPIRLAQFQDAVKSIKSFWLATAALPPRPEELPSI